MDERFMWSQSAAPAVVDDPPGGHAPSHVASAPPGVLLPAAPLTWSATEPLPSPLPAAPAPALHDGYQRRGGPPATATPVTSSMSSRDGVIGLTVGLVLLAATLSGSVALNFVGNRPAAPPAPMTATASTEPAVPPAAVTPAAADTPAPVSEAQPPGAGDMALAADLASPRKPAAPRQRTDTLPKAAIVGKRTGAGGGAPASRNQAPARPAIARQPNRPARPAPQAARPRPAAAPAVVPPAAPQAAPAPAPAAAQPVSWSVSTPGGAHWVAPVSEYDMVRTQVPNATMTPNY